MSFFSARSFLKSIRAAFKGMRTVFAEEQNFRMQLFLAVLVFFAAWWVKMRMRDLLILVLVSGGVLVLELGNSVVERLIDALKPRLSGYAGEVKDIAAAAVLVMALVAAAVGIMVFVPYFTMYG